MDGAVEIFPLDFNSLRKGDVIPASKIEAIYKVSRELRVYSAKQLQLLGMIERRTGFRAVVAGSDIRVLRDDEYAKHTTGRVRGAARKILLTITLREPDLSALSEEQRDDWDRADAGAQRYAAKVAEGRREIARERRALAPCKRPGLPPRT